MSRYYNTSSDTGLSRQSSKNYKVIRKKSNAELNEKLRRIDIEHNTNIAKILNERYNLRTMHYNLTHSGGETSSDSDSEEGKEAAEENGSRCVSSVDSEDIPSVGEKKVQQICAIDNSKKQNFLQLPSIIEETSVNPKQHSKSPKLGHSPLPPLSENGFPTRLRMMSESIHGNAASSRQRQRSSTLPIGHMPGDRLRKSEFKKTVRHEKSTHMHGEGKRMSADDHMPNHEEKLSTSPSWEKELHGCRYLRHKRHSTPDFLDTEAIFDRISEK